MKKLGYSFMMVVLTWLLFVPSAFAMSDVQESDWFYQDVTYIQNQGYIQGFPDGTFRPDSPVTREQVALILGRYAYPSPPTNGTTRFSDVAASSQAAPFIRAFTDSGVINGYPDGTFRPQQTITRGDMAMIIANGFLDSTPVSTVQPTDTNPSHYYYHAVRELYEANVSRGYPDGSFKATEPVTRAEFAAVVRRMIAYIEALEGGSINTEDHIETILENVLEGGRVIHETFGLAGVNNESFDSVKDQVTDYATTWYIENGARQLFDQGAYCYGCDAAIYPYVHHFNVYGTYTFVAPDRLFVNVGVLGGDLHDSYVQEYTLLKRDGRWLIDHTLVKGFPSGHFFSVSQLQTHLEENYQFNVARFVGNASFQDIPGPWYKYQLSDGTMKYAHARLGIVAW